MGRPNLEAVPEPRVRSLGWGILGTGRITARLLRAVGASDRGRVVGVGSRDSDRARSFAARHGIPAAFGSYEELLASPDVDVVYVALPNHLHAEWTIRALEAGKHVLCEKPLALRVADVDAIVAASAVARRVAVEGFMYLHHPQIRSAIELARGGSIGRLQLVHSSFSFFLTYPNDPRLDPSMGGGSLWDVACYPVSLSRRIAREEPEVVAAFGRFDEQGVDRTFVGQMRFPGGLLAQFDSGFAAPDRERAEIVGSEGRIVLEAPFLPAPDGPPASIELWHGRERRVVDVEPVDQYREEVEDLTRVILDSSPPWVDLAFSRGNVATLVELDGAARAASAAPTG